METLIFYHSLNCALDQLLYRGVKIQPTIKDQGREESYLKRELYTQCPIVFRWRNPSRMGGCVGSPAGGRRGSASPSALSDSSLFPTTKNKPLKGERIRSSFDLQ